jgi:hypothetical protein
MVRFRLVPNRTEKASIDAGGRERLMAAFAFP